MGIRFRFFSLFVVLFLIGRSTALIPSKTPNLSSSSSKAISDLKEAIVKGLGLQTDDLKISGFDLRDALVGQSVSYEFDLGIGNRILPFKLLEDVSKWEFVDLPIFQAEEETEVEDSTRLVESSTKKESILPIVAPFQLAGPMEIWIQDADDMRIALPHDVDAGVLKKVVLADGAVVTVKGARSVSLRHPIDLPLPLNRSTADRASFASGLLALAEYLRLSSLSQQDNQPPLSLRIVGPTSLTSSDNGNNKLKLKRLAPGLIELSSKARPYIEETIPLLTPDRFTTLWPLASVNGSNANLRGFEELLASVLGEMANKEGSFRLLKATVSAQTYLKIGFRVEKGLKEGHVDWSAYPEWRTRPEKVRMHFEVLAKVDGEKVVPESVMQVKDPVELEDTLAPNLLNQNVTMSRVPVVHAPPEYFSL